MKCYRPAGFTLVELLVVIAIIGVLVSLLLPAVQAAREMARSRQCQNNLLQLTLAMHNYESVHTVFPPGTIDQQGPIVNAPKGYHHSWIVQVLPYFEQQALYKHIDLSKSAYDVANLPAALITPSILQCPTDPWAPYYDRPSSSYAGCHHDAEAPINDDQSGILLLNKSFSRDDITDGLGYTILLGEKLPDAWEMGWISGTRATLRNTGARLNAFRKDGHRKGDGAAKSTQGIHAQYLANLANSNVMYGNDPDPTSMPDFGWVPDDIEREKPVVDPTLTPASQLPPGFDPTMPTPRMPVGDPEPDSRDNANQSLREGAKLPPPKAGALPPTSPQYVGGFGSMHKNTTHFAFGDGSIRRLHDSIDADVYKRLGSRNDGQLPPRLEP